MALAFGGAPVQRILQQDYLLRVFHDALYPQLLFRADAAPELWEGQKGDEKLFSRTGLMEPDTDPILPGNDAQTDVYPVEQWRAIASQYGKSIDTDMPTSHVVLANKFLRDGKVLGLHAGQTLNRLARNPLYRAYCAGNTAATAIAAIGALQIHVASLNGFTEALNNGRPVPVSATDPVIATFPGIAEPNRNVIAATPDLAAEPLGPGWLTLSAALTVGLAARQAVVAQDATFIHRVGGGNTVDNIGAADILTLQDIIDATAVLEQGNTLPHADGYFHHHMPSTAKAQVFADNAWQRLLESLPDDVRYKKFIIGALLGSIHYKNTECPDNTNTGTLRGTGVNAFCSPQIGAETINENGIRIGRTIITAADSISECYVDESAYISEAGITGKVGSFNVSANGAAVMTERIRMTMRGPLDRLQQKVATTWSFTGDFPIPTDALVGGAARYKRAVVIEFSLGAV